jgi:molecular chaperone DnaJ
MGRELYLILGIEESAPEGEIRKAYQRLARRYHPDINPGDPSAEDLFRRISEAYLVLSDPVKRGFYDTHGYYSDNAGEEGDSRWELAFGGEGSVGPSRGFREMLDGFFGGAKAPDEPGVETDIEAQVSLSFQESMRGLTTHVEVARQVRCDLCEGTGRHRGAGEVACLPCLGQGRQVRSRGHLSFTSPCPACGGTGRIGAACPACGGRGRQARTERIRVEIPPGVGPGSRLRFQGKGHVHPETGERGDMFILTQVAPHPFFRRAGDNLHCRLPVTIPEAALGGKVEVPTIDGSALLRIPPGVQPGQTLRLRGRGAPSLRAEGVRGDQYVEIQVVVPRVMDERSREILRELARLHPENPRKETEGHAR